MQRNLKSKFKKFTTIGLASAMLLTATPLNFANAEGTQTPVATTNQEVAKQALQSYLADSKGLFTAKATAETVNLPFSSELYYGYELLQDEEAKKAFEVIMRELLAYDPTTKRTGVTYGINKNNVGTITINLQELGVNVKASNISNIRTPLGNSDPRLFYLNGGQNIKKDSNGIAQTVTYYVPSGYAKDDKYQKTLLEMEKRASEILSVVDERMTDAQKVAVLYNKFRSMTKYTKNNGHWIMTGPLLEGGGICGGYSYAFQYLLQRAGIETIWARNYDHAWNYAKIDGEWYLVDSTWGGNSWLLRGKSSLSSHNPWNNSYGVVPKIAENNYDLNKTKFNVAEANVNDVVQAVEDVLSDKSVKLSDIKAIVAGNPVNESYRGLKAEVQVKEMLEQKFANIEGTFEIVIHNSTGSETVDEMIERDLTITYQLDGNKDTYTYKQGEIKKK